MRIDLFERVRPAGSAVEVARPEERSKPRAYDVVTREPVPPGLTGTKESPAGAAADRKRVLFAPNIAWRGHPLGERVGREIELPVVVENDANAACWAEYQYGAARGLSDVLMLTVGTGLGGAIVAGGKLVRGAHGIAGEVGHMSVVVDGHPCGCGKAGCWEQYASGSALTREARRVARQDPRAGRALLDLAGGDPEAIQGRHVTKAAVEGDPVAIELLAGLGRWLGRGAAAVVEVLDPALIVVGGGAASAGDLILDSMSSALAENMSARQHRPVPRIAGARFGNDAGLVGAAALALV